MAPSLNHIAALESVQSLPALLAWLHGHGADNALFHLNVEQDFGDAERMIATLDAGGLGLPERDYYLR